MVEEVLSVDSSLGLRTKRHRRVITSSQCAFPINEGDAGFFD